MGTGDICKGETMQLPFNMGSIEWKGLDCPVKKGAVAIDMTMNLASSLPSSLSATTTKVTATGSNGDDLLCLTVNTKGHSDAVALGSSGACSADDKQKINSQPAGTADGSFPKTTSDCGKGALSIWSGINKSKFNQCLQGKYQISGVAQHATTTPRSMALRTANQRVCS